MVLTKKEFEQRKDEFEELYFLNKMCGRYVNGCGSPSLRRMVKEGIIQESDLKTGESLDDRCLFVTFRQEPPKDYNLLPTEYRGVRVYSKVVGEIEVL